MRRAIPESKYPIKSLVKALRILDVLAQRPAGFGITELSEALHIEKSTVHRLS
jgi:DNA-binding IclR family transcriptional regulator